MRLTLSIHVAALVLAPALVQAQGLVSWFQLDELSAANGALNTVPSAAGGTFFGTPVFGEPSASGTAIEFNSPADSLVIQNAAELEGIGDGATITVSFGINSVGSLPVPFSGTVPPAGDYVINSVGSLPQSVFGSSDWLIGIRRSPLSNLIEVVVTLPNGTGMSAELPLQLGDETFLAVVVDPTAGLSFYGSTLQDVGLGTGPALLAGVRGAISIPSASAGTEFRIGSQFSGLGDVLDGFVSELQVFGGVLSQAEIGLLFEAPGSTQHVGTAFCAPSVVNSTGSTAEFAAYGSANVQANNLHLVTTSLPQNEVGYYLASQVQAALPGAGGARGTLCLGSPLVRFQSQVLNSGTAGIMGMTLDLSVALPSSNVMVAAGETWNLQLWYRDIDVSTGGAATDFSGAVSILLQ